MMNKHRTPLTAFLASFAIICFFHGDVIGAANQTHNGFTLKIQNYIPSQNEDSVSVNSPFAVTFSITLEHSQGQRIENWPASIDSVQYTYWVEEQAASSGGTTLSAVVPNTYNRNSSLTFTKSSQAEIDKSARGDMTFSKAGLYRVHLRVEVSFKNSSGILTADNSVKVHVDNVSILTIYAAQPTKTYGRKNATTGKPLDPICYVGGDYGHSFWRISVNPNAVNIQNAPKNLINTKLGFYPKNGKSVTTVLQPMFKGGAVAGKVCTDDTHYYTQVRDFGISTAKAEDVLNQCDEQMKAQNLRYNFLGKFNADNCTQKCNWIAKTIGGVNVPEGIGPVRWKLSTLTGAATLSATIPNPYHHGEQLAP
ncbi:MAG: hypothetical protein LBT24_06695 [Tannerella sp.]|jgi:hypothetical protein|nr:hypothetical protein [Tannerella sp.]